MEMGHRQRQAHGMALVLHQARQTLIDIITERDFDSAELFSSTLKVCWGAWLVGPAQTFNSTPSYASMAALFDWQRVVAPEVAWGLLICAAGLAHLLAILSGSVKHRRRGALTGSGIWAGIAALIWTSNPQGTGWLVYGALAVLAGWAFWRLGLDNARQGHRG